MHSAPSMGFFDDEANTLSRSHFCLEIMVYQKMLAKAGGGCFTELDIKKAILK